MITAGELRAISLFSNTAAGDLERLARRAADVHLEAGHMLLHEGEPSGFYVLISGHLQGTKLIHGTEHEILHFGPGDFFGELPNLLGMPSGISLRASDRCRVVRFEMQQLQELIRADSPTSDRILRTMSQRVVDAQHFVQTMPSTRVVITGPEGSHGGKRVQAFLASNRIPYDWRVREEDMESGAEDVTVLIDDSLRLVNPSLRSMAEALGMQTKPRREDYDVVIIGAGPAGMAAGLYGSSEGLRVLMVERGAAGGQAGTSSRIENYLGFPGGISGQELGHRALQQALRFGAEIAIARSAEAIIPVGREYAVVLDDGQRVCSRCVLVATGVDWRRLRVPGLDPFLGRGVLYGASRTEAMSVAGKKVFLVGGGNSAGQAAMFFSDYAGAVTLLIRGEGLSATMSQYLIDQLASKANIFVQTHTEVLGVSGGATLEELRTLTSAPGRDPGERVQPADALFIMIGAIANTGWLPSTLQRDNNGFIRTGHALPQTDAPRQPLPLETNLPGVFCAGDVRSGSIKRVASSVGEGSMAIAFIHQYLASPY
jgi:thioredoxin reductase (NADPH)